MQTDNAEKASLKTELFFSLEEVEEEIDVGLKWSLLLASFLWAAVQYLSESIDNAAKRFSRRQPFCFLLRLMKS
jgi:hypothetical protein